MEIEIRDRKLKAALEDDALCKRVFGSTMAKFIRLRMDALHAAVSLHTFWPPKSKPERIHELSGNLTGIFSVDLKQPYRLLFKPIINSQCGIFDEQDRWREIKRIEILNIEDTHG